MRTITFFSYKGGVGRTLTATNFAVYLAKLDLSVVVMDFDLDAPGVDSKFLEFTLPPGQRGLIDYILDFQRSGADPGSITQLLCDVPVSSPRREYKLTLIPAGDYLAPDYSAKLNELNWHSIFQSRDGVAFFQVFLERIRQELCPDVLVIDSRTGFSEIGGLCTQQLADETVILSSLAAESVKMTKHLAKLINESEIANKLNKKVETKIVVSRVPKPEELNKLKEACCKKFEVDESRLFFLFSCPGLEEDEFVAMANMARDGDLVANYLQLFQGLDIAKARESIRHYIDQAGSGLLLLPAGSASEAEARIRELVALYPDPEVYRVAMRFFELRRHSDEASRFALRVLDFLPFDPEAAEQIARTILSIDTGGPFRLTSLERISRDVRRLLAIADRAFESKSLSIRQSVRLAWLFEQCEQFSRSYQVACDCLGSEDLTDPMLRSMATAIAARMAIKVGKKEDALKLISNLSVTQLDSSLASAAIDLKLASGEREAAFELAKTFLSHEFDFDVLQMAARLAMELGRRKQLEEAISLNRELQRRISQDPVFLRELERYGLNSDEIRVLTRFKRKG